jgi:hypothetical protein
MSEVLSPAYGSAVPPTEAQLLALGLAPGLSAHLAGQAHDAGAVRPLSHRCQRPHYYYSSPISARPIVPLWECGVRLVYFNRVSSRFEQCSLEDIDAVHAHYPSAQAAVADLFVDLVEDEHGEAELHRAAAQAGFVHLGRLLLEAGRQGAGYEAWRGAFIRSCA